MIKVLVQEWSPFVILQVLFYALGGYPLTKLRVLGGGAHLELDGIKRTFVQLARAVNSTQQLGVTEDRAKLPS